MILSLGIAHWPVVSSSIVSKKINKYLCIKQIKPAASTLSRHGCRKSITSIEEEKCKSAKIIMMYKYIYMYSICHICALSASLSRARLPRYFFHLDPKQWGSSQHFLVWLFFVLIITGDVAFDFGWLNGRENVTYTSALHHAEWSDLVAALSWCTVRTLNSFQRHSNIPRLLFVHTHTHTT